ncbi:MAG TPA: hypothetical protein PKD32_04330 [Saprospiraceae bacterium]|nr:hypothetical protein [Saprospiraceae bacterium]
MKNPVTMNSTFPFFAFILLFSVSQFSCKPGSGTGQNSKELVFKTEPMESSTPFPNAAIQSVAYENGTFKYQISGDYKLGEQTSDAPQKMCANSKDGQHIHLIVDDKPYEARYKDSFHYIIPDGNHYLLSFLSRSYHESIKTNSAFSLMNAEIKDSSLVKVEPVSQPMLFYSRPKGTYVGKDADRVMLDFYVVNCQLGSEYKVKAEVAGNSFVLDKWEPIIMTGLPMGEHLMKLSLVDASGNLVKCPLNPVERKFTLQAEPSVK